MRQTGQNAGRAVGEIQQQTKGTSRVVQ